MILSVNRKGLTMRTHNTSLTSESETESPQHTPTNLPQVPFQGPTPSQPAPHTCPSYHPVTPTDLSGMGGKDGGLYKGLRVSLVAVTTAPGAIERGPLPEPQVWLWSPAVLPPVVRCLGHGTHKPFSQGGLAFGPFFLGGGLSGWR